jgi:hypothetical protein
MVKVIIRSKHSVQSGPAPNGPGPFLLAFLKRNKKGFYVAEEKKMKGFSSVFSYFHFMFERT